MSLRAEAEDDAELRFRLFCSSREDLAIFSALPDYDSLMRMQFRAQSRSYAAAYPRADFFIIELATGPIGRVAVNRSGGDMRLIDIALLPESRNLGVGAAVIDHFQREADARRALLRLTVAHSNVAALRLYRRLGFSEFARDEVYAELAWGPAPLFDRPEAP